MRASELFDDAWYRETYGDVPDTIDALEHYLRVGKVLGRPPHASYGEVHHESAPGNRPNGSRLHSLESVDCDPVDGGRFKLPYYYSSGSTKIYLRINGGVLVPLHLDSHCHAPLITFDEDASLWWRADQSSLIMAIARILCDYSGVIEVPFSAEIITGGKSIPAGLVCGSDPIDSLGGFLEALGLKLNSIMLSARAERYKKIDAISGRKENAYFDDMEYYASCLTAVALKPPPSEIVQAHFNPNWYRQRYQLPKEVDAWSDFLAVGQFIGKDPNPAFSTLFVRAMAGNELVSISNLLAWYIEEAQLDGPAPHPFFDRTTKEVYLKSVTDKKPNSAIERVWIDKSVYLPIGNTVGAELLLDYLIEGDIAGAPPNLLFDPTWYRKKYAYFGELEAAVVNYARYGEKRLRNPSQYFDTRFYLERNADVAAAGVGPLRHYLGVGMREQVRRPSPLFDQAWFLRNAPGNKNKYASLFRDPPLEPLAGHPALVVTPRVTPDEIICSLDLEACELPAGISNALCEKGTRGFNHVSSIRALEEEVAGFTFDEASEVKRSEPIRRMYGTFNEGRHNACLDRAERTLSKGPLELPLVSIIMPARNRAKIIGKAIQSVLRQRYSNFELIVVDDHSDDGTAVAVSRFNDTRIKTVNSDRPGVSAARNKGLEIASGEIIAYLDSDNTWSDFYLSVIVSQFLTGTTSMVHAALRVFNQTGAVRYRGDVYDFDAMDRENYIDMNIFSHRRELIDQGHRFDESLRRCVDWDYIRRAAKIWGPSEYVPFVGCNYLDDKSLENRITSNELQGDFFKLSSQQMNMESHISGTACGMPSWSLIWPLHKADDGDTLRDQIWRACRHLSSSNHEIIFVANDLSVHTTGLLVALSKRLQNLFVINLWRPFLDLGSFALASRVTRSNNQVLWSTSVRYDAKLAAKLAEGKDEAALTFPVVKSGGACDAEDLYAFVGGEGRPIQVEMPASLRSLAGPVSGLFSTRAPVRILKSKVKEIGGANFDFVLEYWLVELASRLLEADLSSVVLRPDLVAVASRPPSEHATEVDRKKEWAHFLETVTTSPSPVTDLDSGAEFQVAVDSADVTVIEGHTCAVSSSIAAATAPSVVRQKYSFLLHCPAPVGPDRFNWGDLHYAIGVKAALEAEGHAVSIRLREEWDVASVTADFTLHLRGIIPLAMPRSTKNIVWVISHLDKMTEPEACSADLVLAPSSGSVKYLRDKFGVAAATVMQAMDPSRFSATGVRGLAEAHNYALFVGNSRKQPRKIVLDAVEANIPIKVYGRDWSMYIDDEYIQASYLPNEKLARYYESAKVVLNDHWPVMARYGIVSNRLFDVVASGGVAISDPVDGLEDLFDGHVRSYRSVEELGALVESLDQWAPATAQRIKKARQICQEHSFEARTRQILTILKAGI